MNQSAKPDAKLLNPSLMAGNELVGQLPSLEHETIVEWLRKPQSYPEQPENVQLIETHISQVFLTDHYAYKLKKPVRYDFLDFSTLILREKACREELRLNRRMTHDVYLDVWPITQESSGTLQLNGCGYPVDWVVRMRRLPVERMPDELICGHRLIPADLRHLTDHLVSFYAHAAPLRMSPENYHASLMSHVRGNLEELLASIAIDVAQVRRVISPQLQLLHCQASLFSTRALGGHRAVCHDILDFCARVLDILADRLSRLPCGRLLCVPRSR